MQTLNNIHGAGLVHQLRIERQSKAPDRFITHDHIEQQKANTNFLNMAPNITINGRYNNKFQKTKNSINNIVNAHDRGTPQFKQTSVNKSRRYQLKQMDKNNTLS